LGSVQPSLVSTQVDLGRQRSPTVSTGPKLCNHARCLPPCTVLAAMHCCACRHALLCLPPCTVLAAMHCCACRHARCLPPCTVLAAMYFARYHARCLLPCTVLAAPRACSGSMQQCEGAAAASTLCVPPPWRPGGGRNRRRTQVHNRHNQGCSAGPKPLQQLCMHNMLKGCGCATLPTCSDLDSGQAPTRCSSTQKGRRRCRTPARICRSRRCAPPGLRSSTSTGHWVLWSLVRLAVGAVCDQPRAQPPPSWGRRRASLQGESHTCMQVRLKGPPADTLLCKHVLLGEFAHLTALAGGWAGGYLNQRWSHVAYLCG
jgi:hypothetical protein